MDTDMLDWPGRWERGESHYLYVIKWCIVKCQNLLWCMTILNVYLLRSIAWIICRLLGLSTDHPIVIPWILLIPYMIYWKRLLTTLALSWATLISIFLTHWGRATHICVSILPIIGSDIGLSPGRRQAIIWTNAGLLLIEPLRTKFSEMLIEIYVFSFTKMHLEMSSGKWRPFCLGLNVLNMNYIAQQRNFSILGMLIIIFLW